MAYLNSQNRDRRSNHLPSAACANCCHYCPQTEQSAADTSQESNSSSFSSFFVAVVVIFATVLMFGSANATFPTQLELTPSPTEIEGDIRESLLPYGEQSG